MADRAVVVRLRAEVAEYKRAMAAASKATEDVGKSAAKSEQDTRNLANMQMQAAREMKAAQAESARRQSEAMTTVGTGLVAVGAAAAAGVGLAVAKFADFDASMSKAQAGTMATGASLDSLREAAVKSGAATQYSASEAADGITELGKAGVETKDILNGGLKGALSLAAAGQIEVARASEIAGVTLKQFNLEGKDLPHVADLLAAGAGKAVGGVEDMAQALKYVGPVAKNLDVSLEQTTGVIAELASQGIIGEQAGTGLRGMIMSLTAPSKIAATEMATLGMNMYDASGKFIGLDGAAQQLQDRMGTLSEADRNASMGRIFGNEQITAATILYTGGAAAVDEWTKKVDDSGFAAKQAAMLTDNLKGDVERLGGSLDTALIQTGSGANGVLRDMAQAAEGAVNAVGSMPPAALNTTLAIGGVVAAAGLLGGGFLIAAPRIVETRAALATLSTTAPRATAALTTVGKAAGTLVMVAIAATALNHLADSVGSQAQPLGETTDALLKAGDAAKSLDASFASLHGLSGAADFDSTAEAIERLTDPTLMQRFGDFASTTSGLGLINRAGASDRKRVIEQFDGISKSLGSLVSGGNIDLAREKFADLRAAWEAQGGSIKDLRDLMPEYVAALTDAGNAEVLAGEGGTKLADGIAPVAPETEAATKALEDWMKMVSEADAGFIDLGAAWDDVIQHNTDVATSTADSTKSSKDSWTDYYDGVTVSTEAYLKNLEDQVEAQQNWETNLLLLSGRASQGVIDALTAMGVEGAPIVAQFVNASDEEMARLEAVYGQRTAEATARVAENLRTAGPTIAAAGAQLGTKAANEIAAKLASGEITVQQAIDRYHLRGVKVPVDVNTDPAQAQLDAWVAKNNAIHPSVRIANGRGSGGITKAEGGSITGPGTGTSDDIPAWLSNGEHVLTADDVVKAGGQGGVYRMRQMIQDGDLKFAKGGGVGHVKLPVTMDTSKLTVPDGGGGSGGGSASSSTLVAFGRMIQAMGFQVTEHPLFGGVHPGHMKGSKHYRGAALDVNHGAGTSRAEQAALSGIVGLARKMGLGTIFMSAGHYNHAHVESRKAGGAIGRSAARPLARASGGSVAQKAWQSTPAYTAGYAQKPVVVNTTVTLEPGALAQAMAGTELTLLVDGRPIQAIVRTELSAEASAVRQRPRR